MPTRLLGLTLLALASLAVDASAQDRPKYEVSGFREARFGMSEQEVRALVTKTVGGIAGIFDAKTQTFVALSEAAATPQAGEPALKADSLAPLNDFKPATFFAVTVK